MWSTLSKAFWGGSEKVLGKYDEAALETICSEVLKQEPADQAIVEIWKPILQDAEKRAADIVSPILLKQFLAKTFLELCGTSLRDDLTELTHLKVLILAYGGVEDHNQLPNLAGIASPFTSESDESKEADLVLMDKYHEKDLRTKSKQVLGKLALEESEQRTLEREDLDYWKDVAEEANQKMHAFGKMEFLLEEPLNLALIHVSKNPAIKGLLADLPRVRLLMFAWGCHILNSQDAEKEKEIDDEGNTDDATYLASSPSNRPTILSPSSSSSSAQIPPNDNGSQKDLSASSSHSSATESSSSALKGRAVKFAASPSRRKSFGFEFTTSTLKDPVFGRSPGAGIPIRRSQLADAVPYLTELSQQIDQIHRSLIAQMGSHDESVLELQQKLHARFPDQFAQPAAREAVSELQASEAIANEENTFKGITARLVAQQEYLSKHIASLTETVSSVSAAIGTLPDHSIEPEAIEAPAPIPVQVVEKPNREELVQWIETSHATLVEQLKAQNGAVVALQKQLHVRLPDQFGEPVAGAAEQHQEDNHFDDLNARLAYLTIFVQSQIAAQSEKIAIISQAVSALPDGFGVPIEAPVPVVEVPSRGDLLQRFDTNHSTMLQDLDAQNQQIVMLQQTLHSRFPKYFVPPVVTEVQPEQGRGSADVNDRLTDQQTLLRKRVAAQGETIAAVIAAINELPQNFGLISVVANVPLPLAAPAGSNKRFDESSSSRDPDVSGSKQQQRNVAVVQPAGNNSQKSGGRKSERTPLVSEQHGKEQRESGSRATSSGSGQKQNQPEDEGCGCVIM